MYIYICRTNAHARHSDLLPEAASNAATFREEIDVWNASLLFYQNCGPRWRQRINLQYSSNAKPQGVSDYMRYRAACPSIRRHQPASRSNAKLNEVKLQILAVEASTEGERELGSQLALRHGAQEAGEDLHDVS